MDQLKKNILFYILLLIDFYVIPLFIKDTGSSMIVMLMIIPLIGFITVSYTHLDVCKRQAVGRVVAADQMAQILKFQFG